MAGTTYAASVAALAIMWYGSSLVALGALTAGELTSFLLYAGYVGGSLISISYVVTGMMKAVGASQRIFEITNQGNKVDIFTGNKIEKLNGHIVFKDVSFYYPVRPSSQIFDQLNFEIPPGKVTAVVGSSGSGKV